MEKREHKGRGEMCPTQVWVLLEGRPRLPGKGVLRGTQPTPTSLCPPLISQRPDRNRIQPLRWEWQWTGSKQGVEVGWPWDPLSSALGDTCWRCP